MATIKIIPRSDPTLAGSAIRIDKEAESCTTVPLGAGRILVPGDGERLPYIPNTYTVEELRVHAAEAQRAGEEKPGFHLSVPMVGEFHLHNLVSDYTGTLSCAGKLVTQLTYDKTTFSIRDTETIRALLRKVAAFYDITILTGDTQGTAKATLEPLVSEGVIRVLVLQGSDMNVVEWKANFVEWIGKERTLTLGNGNNDVGMFRVSRLSMVVNTGEGASRKAREAATLDMGRPEHALTAMLPENFKLLLGSLREGG